MFGFGSKDENNTSRYSNPIAEAFDDEFIKSNPLDLGPIKVFKPGDVLRISPVQPQPTADSILDEAVSKLIVDRDHHAERAAYWQAVLDDARQRLKFHTTIHDALQVAIAPIVAADVSFDPEEVNDVQPETDGNSETAGGKSDADAVSGSVARTARRRNNSE